MLKRNLLCKSFAKRGLPQFLAGSCMEGPTFPQWQATRIATAIGQSIPFQELLLAVFWVWDVFATITVRLVRWHRWMDALFANEYLADWLRIAIARFLLDVDLELFGRFRNVHLRVVHDGMLLETGRNS